MAALARGGAGASTAPPRLLVEPDLMIPLWPGDAPGRIADIVEGIEDRTVDPDLPDRALHGVSRPRMAVFRPGKPNGAAVLIMPGGGYQRVVMDKEGYELAARLAAGGFCAFVLFYRLPAEGWRTPADTPLADAQRAMRLIRAGAANLGLDPTRVAAVGFSAGGHLCADLATRFGARVYDPIDASDAYSARPFCFSAIYPVVSMDPAIAHAGSRRLLLGPSPDAGLAAAHSPDLNVSANTPPSFVLHAEDDPVVPVENSLRLRAALKAKGVSVETHLFREGGHGFGLRRAMGKPAAVWPDLWRAWAYSIGLA